MIRHAAMLRDGIVYVGHRHHNCIATMRECGIPWPVTQGAEQGFVDHNGNFLNRKLALYEAMECNQIIKKHAPLDELHSEDIY
jgi:hypothetical protein